MLQLGVPKIYGGGSGVQSTPGIRSMLILGGLGACPPPSPLQENFEN